VVDALMALAARHPIAMPVVPDLLWGEIDFRSHYRRIVDRVWPAVAALLAREAESGPRSYNPESRG
jgi:hypothetical protein